MVDQDGNSAKIIKCLEDKIELKKGPYRPGIRHEQPPKKVGPSLDYFFL